MYLMFKNCSSLTSLNLSKFNTSNVVETAYMFSECSSLKSLDLSNFDTSKVSNMDYMFNGTSCLESLDISNFNTSNAKQIKGVFNNSQNLDFINLLNYTGKDIFRNNNKTENLIICINTFEQIEDSTGNYLKEKNVTIKCPIPKQSSENKTSSNILFDNKKILLNLTLVSMIILSILKLLKIF